MYITGLYRCYRCWIQRNSIFNVLFFLILYFIQLVFEEFIFFQQIRGLSFESDNSSLLRGLVITITIRVGKQFQSIMHFVGIQLNFNYVRLTLSRGKNVSAQLFYYR